MSEYSTVTFDGDQSGTYYIAVDMVQYLTSDLFNNGSNTIYLYKNQTTHDESITIPSLSYPRYRTGNYNTYAYITNATNVRFSSPATYAKDSGMISMVAMSIICFCVLVRLFK